MSTTVDVAFAEQFNREVHILYQNKGGYMRPTVRTQMVNDSETAHFQRIGTGKATQKARHGEVPATNIEHTRRSVTPEDWYAKEYVDKLDVLKTNIDERTALQNALSYALGRKTDEIIMNVMDAGGTQLDATTTGGTLDKSRALALLEAFGDASVPDDGGRYCAVGWHQWAELLNISEFNNADFVSMGGLPLPRGTQPKMWLGIIWFPVEDLPKSGDIRSCFGYHRNAVGLGVNKETETDFFWNGEKYAWSITSCLSMGSVIIDDAGSIRFRCDDTTSIS